MRPERNFVAERAMAQHSGALLAEAPAPGDLLPLLSAMGTAFARQFGRALAPLLGGNPAEAAATKPAEAPKTTAEKDIEFRKRQQEAREKADKDAKQQAAAAQKRENCERARMQASALESGRRMLVPDGKGGETLMDDDARAGEIERAQRTIAEACN